MAVSHGFFNSVSSDRLYNAESFNRMFEGLIRDGILASVDNALSVVTNTGMSTKVGTGKAWFNWSWIQNDSDLVVNHAISHPTLERIDTIVMDFNKQAGTRTNTIVVLQGPNALVGTAVAPTLINIVDRKQIPLANVKIRAATTTITAGDITNRRGTADCPFATGILEQADLTDMFNQWQYDFDQWFLGVQDILDETAEGNILTLIDDLGNRPKVCKNLILNGAMSISQLGYSIIENPVSSFNGYPTATDMWRAFVGSAGTVKFENLHNGYGDFEHRVTVTAGTNSNPVAGAQLYVEQRIVGDSLGESFFGFPNAKKLQLSFTVKTNCPGDYVVEIIHMSGDVHISKKYTLVSGENKITIEIPKNINSKFFLLPQAELQVRFWLSAGSTYSTGSERTVWTAESNANRAPQQTHLSRTTNNYWALKDVQLEVGEYPTSFERLPDDYQLRRIQRFFETGRRNTVVSIDPASAAIAFMIVGLWNVQKAWVPVVSITECKALLASGFRDITDLGPAGDPITELCVSGSIVGATAGAMYRGLVTFVSRCDL